MSEPTVISGPAGELPAGPPGQLLMDEETGDFFYRDDDTSPVTPPLRLASSVSQSSAPGYYLVGTEAYSVEATGAAPISNLDKWRKVKPVIWADGSSELIVVADDAINTPDYTVGQLWIRQVATALGCTVNNQGNGGRIRLDVVLDNLTPGAGAFQPGSTSLVTQSAGGNDFPRAWATEVGRRGFKNQTSALLGIYRHKSRVMPGLNETGTWGQSENQYSGKTRKSTVRGSTQTIRFTGTGATLFMLGYTNLVAATAFAGSEFTWSLDGSAPVSRSTKRQGITGTDKAKNSVLPIHFRDLEDTEHTVVITHTGSAGDPLIVDQLMVWQKRVQDMPFVLMLPPAKTTARGLLLYPSPRPPAGATEAFRQLQEDAFDEFGRDGTFGGIPGDVLDRWYPPREDQVLGDGLHPDLSGHTAIKEAALEGLALYQPTSYLADPTTPPPDPTPDPGTDPDPSTDPDPDPGTDPEPGTDPTPDPGTPTPHPVYSKELAMATVYGTLTDLAREPLNDRAIRLRFVPSGPGVAGGRLLSQAPIEVEVQPGGVFSADIFTTTTISPETWFTIELGYLVAGQAAAYELIPGKLRVPEGGGAVGDLLDTEPPPGVIAVGLGLPDKNYAGYIDLRSGIYYTKGAAQ
ncbi:hypothetical protein [Rathayibacter sp. AY2B5]|uniref:hypothetical protein n=1 Tax=Rathayibacter sp. AY2B5 TaxID=2080570 RepID=UPI0015E33A46|nr:hypothetical protein [Rathayibacter sp. AY2B5]